jgi:phage-related protein
VVRRPTYSRPPKRLPVVFYRLASGKEPVREWLTSPDLSVDDRRRIGESIRTVELGWPIGMPVCRALGAGVWEVRVRLENRGARVVFCVHDGHMVLLHAFMKKFQATSARDLDVARQRRRDLERHR